MSAETLATPSPEPPEKPSPGLTEQQQLAVVTREVSIVLSSGAGCGKTHVLTERYLSHLRTEDIEVSQLVAITFTERAARQMRERIRKAIQRHLREAETEEEADRWAKHLRGLETAPISTIHAFCGTLLRQHAVQAALDPSFDVLEDVLAVNLETEALSLCLQRLLTAETEVGQDLRELVLLFGWRTVVDTAQHLMHHWDEHAWQSDLARTDEELIEEWHHYGRNVLLPRYLEYVLAVKPKFSRLLPLLQNHPPEPGPFAENVAILNEELPNLARAENLGEVIEKLNEAAKVGRTGKKGWPDEDTYEQIKNAFSDFRDELKKLKLDRFDLDAATLPPALETGRRFLRVVREAQQTYRERKRFHGVADFQDLLLLARDLLRDHPEVRHQLQDRFRALLIDELQDTDPVQMELVEHLSGAGLTTGKVFAVGDHSQSIYRFRGANVHLFQNLRETMPHEGRQGLTVNFRSQPAILDFTNALLGHRLTDYEPLVAFHPQVNPNPCVELLWSAADDNDNAVDQRLKEAEGIASRISQMVDRGEKLVREDGNLRAVKRGDIVLLFRAMTHVHLYENALRRRGLDYYLVGGRAFFAQQEIYDLLHLLRTLENPHDEVSLAGTLRSPFCCMSDETLFLLRFQWKEDSERPRRRSLWEGLFDDKALERIPECEREVVLRSRRFLSRWRKLKDRLPIARLLEEVFSDSGYDAAMQLEFLGDRKLANLWKLMDLARTFDRSGLFGLAELIARLDDLVSAQPREEQAATQPENADVIRLMSIHQSKGLEFPVVIIPDMNADTRGPMFPTAHWDRELGCVVRPPSDEDPPPFTDYGWTLWKAREEIEDWHESLRTLYVACTRAEDFLILSSAVTPSFQPKSIWMQTLAERFDLFSGQCLASGVERIPQVRVRDREPIIHSVHVDEQVVEKTLPVSHDFSFPETAKSIPVRREQQRIFTLAEVENPSTRSDFETEDSSDLNQWRTRRARRSSGEEERLKLFREIFQNVDLQKEDGWQSIWNERVEQSWMREEDTELKRWLEGFASSEVFQGISKSTVCHRELEFLLQWPSENPPNGFAERPWVRGVIDGAWQDEKGDWHLLAFSAETAPIAKTTKPLEHRAGLIFWTRAIKEMMGKVPADLTIYFLPQATMIQSSAKRLPLKKTLDQLAQNLRNENQPDARARE